jgi:NAD(P)-dependent dehydrogenase (short-subunit alcohol dehydrogenase family)
MWIFCPEVTKLSVHPPPAYNVATQRPVEAPEEITEEQWLRTFEVNMHSYFRVTSAALPHLGKGSAIINTASVNGLRGHHTLIDYSATKGAIIAWTYSMAQALAGRGDPGQLCRTGSGGANLR